MTNCGFPCRRVLGAAQPLPWHGSSDRTAPAAVPIAQLQPKFTSHRRRGIAASRCAASERSVHQEGICQDRDRTESDGQPVAFARALISSELESFGRECQHRTFFWKGTHAAEHTDHCYRTRTRSLSHCFDPHNRSRTRTLWSRHGVH